MEQHRQQAQPRPSERGATAIEFALVFPLLFGVFWAIISYALPFFLYQVMNYAVSETARDAVRYESVVSQATCTLSPIANLPNDNTIKGTLRNRLSVLPQRFRDSLRYKICYDPSVTLGTGTFETLTITLTYLGCSSSNTAGCITPVLNLFGVSLPNLAPYTATTTTHLGRTS